MSKLQMTAAAATRIAAHLRTLDGFQYRHVCDALRGEEFYSGSNVEPLMRQLHLNGDQVMAFQIGVVCAREVRMCHQDLQPLLELQESANSFALRKYGAQHVLEERVAVLEAKLTGDQS